MKNLFLIIFALLMSGCVEEVQYPMYFEVDPTYPELLAPTEAAIESWSARLPEAVGAKIFQGTDLANTTKGAGSCDIVFITYVKELEMGTKYTDGFYWEDWKSDGCIRTIKIKIRENRRPSELHSVLTHEIGHSMGLNHVEDKTSLMNAIIEVTEPSEFDIQSIIDLFE